MNLKQVRSVCILQYKQFQQLSNIEVHFKDKLNKASLASLLNHDQFFCGSCDTADEITKS